MRKIIGKLAAVLGYILILCYFLRSEWTQLFSLRMAGMLLLGTGLLSLPGIKGEYSAQERQAMIGKNALTAGYLEAFMLIFVSMSTGGSLREELLIEMGLNLRPILYGYILYIILEKDEDGKEAEKKEENAAEEQEQEKRTPLWEDERLTCREREISILISRGLSNREIAEELCISETTVKKHVSNIFEKLGISSRKEIR